MPKEFTHGLLRGEKKKEERRIPSQGKHTMLFTGGERKKARVVLITFLRCKVRGFPRRRGVDAMCARARHEGAREIDVKKCARGRR